jgi:hypothetical protein
MRKNSGSTRRTEVRHQRSYPRQAPRSMKSPGCSSASSRRAGGAGCTGMIGLLSLGLAVLVAGLVRLGRGR